MLVVSDSSGPQPEMPFFSYTLINSHLHLTVDVVDHEVFNLVISITCHSNDEFEALNYAGELTKALRGRQSSATLSQAGIGILEISDPTDRSSMLVNDYVYSVGFDLTLQVRDDYEQNLNLISSVEITNKNNDSKIEKED